MGIWVQKLVGYGSLGQRDMGNMVTKLVGYGKIGQKIVGYGRIGPKFSGIWDFCTPYTPPSQMMVPNAWSHTDHADATS